jgi:FAD/FMN-containing dehydrogenase
VYIREIISPPHHTKPFSSPLTTQLLNCSLILFSPHLHIFTSLHLHISVLINSPPASRTMRYNNLSTLAAWLLPVLGLVTGATCQTDEQRAQAEIEARLPALLSEEAILTMPGGDKWDALNIRVSTPRLKPGYLAIVEVATEEDVQNVIKLANEIEVPFLAVSGAHGHSNNLKGAQGAIQINMRRLNNISLAQDGASVSVGGGTLQHELVDYLYARGKQAHHGTCQCISVAGPLLGGGHGMLQSKAGFHADQLLSARIVTADGSVVTASDYENQDLFWALRGAGHNFGIATSLTLRTYDEYLENWHSDTMTFSHDKFDAYLETWNRLETEIEEPGLLLLNGHFVRIPSIDPDHLTIDIQFFWQGNDSAIEAYKTAFRELEPINEVSSGAVSWQRFFQTAGLGLDGPLCTRNNSAWGFPTSLTKWNIEDMRKGFELLTEFTEDPQFGGAAWILQSGHRGSSPSSFPPMFNAIPDEEREKHLLTVVGMNWAGNDPADAAKAEEYGRAIQAAAVGGDMAEHHSYVNYAAGFEPIEDIYGHQEERLAKLRTLKQQWDPNHSFSFYAPIE